MSLPVHFMEEGLEIAKTATLFGRPMTSLSRDELLAASANGWACYSRLLDARHRSSEFTKDLAQLRTLKEK